MMDGYTHTRKPAGDALLVTGATGFLGQEILLRYLERSERPIYALIRAENDLQARSGCARSWSCCSATPTRI